MKLYLLALRNFLYTELEYRSNVVGLILMELLGLGSVLFIFGDAFRNQETIAGYSRSDLLNYYLFMPVIGFMTQVKLSDALGYQIKDGKISHLLLKPLYMSGWHLMKILGSKLVLLSICLPLYAIILWFASSTGIDMPLLSLQGILGTLLVVIGAFALHYCLEYMISGLAFFMDDVWALEHFKNIVIGVLGGLSFPLAFLPGAWQVVFEILPFKFLYYTPLLYVIGKRDIQSIAGDLLGLGFWMIVFVGLAKLVWSLGLRKYGAYGN